MSKNDSKKITVVFEKITGLSFVEDRIAVVVLNWISSSGQNVCDMVKLRFNLEPENKPATLIHELRRRLVTEHVKKDIKLDAHCVPNLFLYDVWIELYGKAFADRVIEAEEHKNKFQEILI